MMSLRHLLLSLLIVIGLMSGVNTRVDAADLTDVVAEADKAMGRVFVSTASGLGSGSGFVIGRDGNDNPVFLTNYHVIENGTEILVVFRDGTSLVDFTGQVIAASRDLDMAALVLFPGESRGFTPSVLPISVRELPKGETVAALGYPATSDAVVADPENIAFFETTLTQGLVSKVFVSTWQDATEEVEIVQHTAAINRGNSGGPLLDECGQTVGMNTAGLLDGGNVFLASSARSIAGFLDEAGIAYRSSTAKCGQIAEPGFTTDPVAADSVAADPEADAAASGQDVLDPLVPTVVREAIWQNVLLAIGIALALGLVIALFAFALRRSDTTEAKTAAPALMLSLRTATGPTLARPLSAGALARGVILGRGEGADIDIDVTGISRQHARLWVENRKLMLADLGSRNGTTADGVPLQQGQTRQVNSGSVLLLAGIVTVEIGRR